VVTALYTIILVILRLALPLAEVVSGNVRKSAMKISTEWSWCCTPIYFSFSAVCLTKAAENV
jgi:hypothetical protein